METVLVTGGAGFIGSHLVDSLVRRGSNVRVLDCLDSQVHGQGEQPPSYLNPAVELVVADIRDREALRRTLDGVDRVYHLAAAVGVGQSMYEIERYVSVNTLGTAALLDVLANHPNSVRKLVVASSMSIYGEGSYECPSCGGVEPPSRGEEQMRDALWEPLCPGCGTALRPVATAETKPLVSSSIYAISKKDQEEMSLCVGKAYGLPTVALRFFNVYGPRQTLSNPYTGAVAIFSSRAMNGNPPLIYEDGMQTRDFVHVSDVVQALLLAMDSEETDYRVFNVGTGQPRAIIDVANAVCDMVGPPGLQARIVGKYRKGDIRHCYADISRLSDLGYAPRTKFQDGMRELVGWLGEQSARDMVEQASSELERRGLIS